MLVLSVFWTNTEASSLSKDNSDPYFTEGIALFESGRFEKAFQNFAKALEEDPGNLDLNFYFGRAAYEIGDFETAVMAFERILLVFPNADRVKLEIARAYQKLGANDMARRYCKEVLAADPPEPVKNNIHKFLSYIDKTEQEHFINGQLIIDVGWDNNVWATPSDNTIDTVLGDLKLSGPSSEEVSDWIYSTTLGISHTYKDFYSNHYWKTRATVYEALHDKTNELDIRYVGAESGPGFASGKNRYELFFLLNQLELDNTEYLDQYGVKGVFDHAISSDMVIGTSMTLAKKNFNDNPEKDANNKSISVYTQFTLNGTLYFLNFKAEKESAFSDAYDFKRFTSDITLKHQLPYELIGSVYYGYQFSSYDETNALFDTKRRDSQHTAGVSLERRIWQSASNPARFISCRANYRHIQTDSNIDLYEYDKDVFSLSIILNF